jgi:hypothetical protein
LSGDRGCSAAQLLSRMIQIVGRIEGFDTCNAANCTGRRDLQEFGLAGVLRLSDRAGESQRAAEEKKYVAGAGVRSNGRGNGGRARTMNKRG